MGEDRKEKDPYTSFNFYVEIDGVSVAAFASVSGLSVQTDVFDFQEGGVNDHTHRLVGQTKWSNIVLKRGFTDSKDLWSWMEEVANASKPTPRKNGSIVMVDINGSEVKRWNFERGWPCKWEGPGLDAGKNEVAIEALELAHDGFSVN